jgi:hypothetical protein
MIFAEKFYNSRDGLQLYYRDYAGDASSRVTAATLPRSPHTSRRRVG